MNKKERGQIANDVTKAINALSNVFRFVTENHLNQACRAWSSHILQRNNIATSNTNLLEVSEMLFKGIYGQKK